MLAVHDKVGEVDMAVAPFGGADLSNAPGNVPGMDAAVVNDQKAVDEAFE